MREAVERDPRRRGGATLAAIVADLTDEPVLTRSELEARMRDLCDAHGIERPVVNALVAGYEVDFLWPGPRVIVETDGHEHHGTRTAFERDRARDAHLMALGYRVLRFTYRQVVEDPGTVLATLRAVLA